MRTFFGARDYTSEDENEPAALKCQHLSFNLPSQMDPC